MLQFITYLRHPLTLYKKKNNQLAGLFLLIISSVFCLGIAGQPIEEIKHEEIIHKDLTGDGIEEKLVFAYSGPDIRLLDVSFRIFQINPSTKAETEIFSEKWNTEDIYNDRHGPDYSVEKVKYYISGFFDRFCFESSKNKMCQSKCLGSLWCRESEIKRSIAVKLMTSEEYRKWDKWREANLKNIRKEINQKAENPNFDWWAEFDNALLASMPVDKEKVELIFQEIFLKNDFTCFAYEPYPEDPQMFVWSPSLKQFILIGGCH